MSVVFVVAQVQRAKVELSAKSGRSGMPTAHGMIAQRQHRGAEAKLKELDVDNFCAKLKLLDGSGTKITLPYEHFSKLHTPS